MKRVLHSLMMLAAMPAASAAAAEQTGGYFDDWYGRVSAAQSSQPHWMTPLMTVTPRLEQEFRYDQYWEHTHAGADIAIADAGKGLELIPTTTNEVLINLPPYEDRTGKAPTSGLGDWPILTIKQRLLSANEDNGNYVVTAFVGVQAPLGASAFTNHAWVFTPTLAAGKGWGDFDIQGTISASLPTAHSDVIGTAIVGNLALQYHLGQYFWPEIEFNGTTWSGGVRDGLSQLFMTTGVILGRFPISDRSKIIVGGGYQVALTDNIASAKAVTPVYERNWLLSTRIAF